MAPKKAGKRSAEDSEGGHPPSTDKGADEGGKKPKKEKYVVPDRIDQTPAPRQHQPPTISATSRPTFKAVAWNVAGIRSLLEKNPAMLQKIASEEAPDVICVQEHKLQETHVPDVVARLRELLPDYPTMHFAVSTAKKGYSGVAVFARAALATGSAEAGGGSKGGGGGGGRSGGVEDEKKSKAKKQSTLLGFVSKAKSPATTEEPPGKPPPLAAAAGAGAGVTSTGTAASSSSSSGALLLRITEGFGDFKSGYTDEGRVITLEYDCFFLVLTYVPNSGQKLERLGYRLEKWDPDFRAYLSHLDATKPVVIGGDLNVGHLDLDIYNVGAPHIKKTSGLTPQERASWTETLSTTGEAGLVDTFRHFHPEASGWYTYWSGRAGNRPVNKGLRIDGFAASKRAIVLPTTAAEGDDEKEKVKVKVKAGGDCGIRVVDGFILDKLTVSASDHAPIGVTLAL